MDEQINIVLSHSTYTHYLTAYLKWEIVRDMLKNVAPYQWESIIRGVFDIPKEDKE